VSFQACGRRSESVEGRGQDSGGVRVWVWVLFEGDGPGPDVRVASKSRAEVRVSILQKPETRTESGDGVVESGC
jgi:hypothetical protein